MAAAGWVDTPISELLVFKNGLNKSKEFFGSGTPIINFMDVMRHTEIQELDVVGRVNLATDEIKRFSARKHDLFFTRTSETVDEIGTASLLIDSIPGAVFSGFILRGRPKRLDVVPEFLVRALKTQAARDQIVSTATYTTRALTNGGALGRVIVPLPNAVEQAAIADALRDVESLIASLEQVIAKKRAIKQGLLQELLTGHTRLPGFAGSWDTTTFGRVAGPVKDRVDPRLAAGRVVELEHISQGSGQLLGHADLRDSASVKTAFKQGDVLFGKLRAYLRKYWLADRDGFCSTEIWALRARPLVVSEFLRYVVEQDAFIDTASTAYGTHMPRSDWGVVSKWELQLPPADEQRAIARILLDVDAEIELLGRRIAATRAVKQGMMQGLLTGRTRLRADKEPTVA